MSSSEFDQSNEDGQRLPWYGERNRILEWRANLFGLSRSRNAATLLKARDIAYRQKLAVIDRHGRRSGSRAGYDPAGAGSPWYSIGPRNVNGRIKSICVHPTDPETIYAGAAAGGVWKSVNGGQRWDPLWDMQESMAIGAIAVAPGSPNTVYAGTGEWTDYGGAYAGTGVYVSTDNGATWSRRPAVKSRHIGKIVVDPTNAQRLWLCGDSGLEHSTDAAVTWDTLLNETVTDVVLDPLNPNTVFIAVRYHGFYKSTDGGNTFTLLPGSPTGAIVDYPQIAIGKAGVHTNNFIVVQMGTTVQRSIDGGQTFTVVPGSHGNINKSWDDVIAVASDNESIIFWGGVGLERTDNSGTSWTSFPQVHADQHAIVFAPSNPNVVYFANDGGVWRSDDKGATIRKVSNGLVVTQFYNIGIWSTLSNVIGGGSQDTGINLTTGGLSWKPIHTGDGGWVVIDPTDPRTIYSEVQGTWPDNIFKTTDGGLNWAVKTQGIVGPKPWEGIITMDPKDHLTVFYGTDRVLRSTDGLATPWTESSQILSGQVSAIAIAALAPRIYAGTTSGFVYRSNDGGNTKPWTDMTGTLPRRPITSVTTTDTGDGVMVSVGGLSSTASSQSIYHSTDGGNTWTDVSGDLPRVVGNSALIDPSNDSIYYLATDTGLWRSTNQGTNWLAFDNGIPNVPCTGLVVDRSSKLLYCSTMGRGAYKLDITPEVTKRAIDLYVRDDDLDTGERIPSPSGLPDPLIPSPGLAHFWMSPDIKVNHQPYLAGGGVLDGVEFDTELVHQDPFRGASNRFYVQVHNRGWQTTSNVRVRAFIADASGGLPDLPNPLTPPNFDLVNTINWTPVGAAQTVAQLEPNRPAIVYWDFTIPVGEATHSCCLVVLSSADDPYTNLTTNIGQLVTSDKHACLKNLHVVDPGPGGMPPSKHTIDLHNPYSHKALIDIIIRPNGFPSGRIGLLLPKITFANPEDCCRGVIVTRLAHDDPVGTWYIPSADGKNKKYIEHRLQERFLACDRRHIYEFDTSITESSLRGIEMAPNQILRAILVSTLKNDVYLTGPARFDVIQLLDSKIAGGSTFQFGYELPPPGTVQICRRIRITADSIKWGRERHELVGRCDIFLARVILADDLNRTYDRILPETGHHDHDHHRGEHSPYHPEGSPKILFDGMIQEGDSLSLSIVSVHIRTQHGQTSEHVFFVRRFEGRKGIRSWLGEHEDRGEDGFVVKYGIDELQSGGEEGEAD